MTGSHQQLVAFTSWSNVSPGVSDTQGHTGRVFGIVEKRTLSLRRVKESNHLRVSAKPNSGVAANSSLQEGSMVRIAYHRSTKGPDEIVRRYNNNAPTRQICAVDLALKTSIGEQPPPGKVNSTQPVWVLSELLRAKIPNTSSGQCGSTRDTEQSSS